MSGWYTDDGFDFEFEFEVRGRGRGSGKGSGRGSGSGGGGGEYVGADGGTDGLACVRACVELLSW